MMFVGKWRSNKHIWLYIEILYKVYIIIIIIIMKSLVLALHINTMYSSAGKPYV